ncbi:GTP cyclohydrolase II [Streptomyces sp. T028]|uniref:GTP cyclohydrolase II n=1 Tax=Streptomyces sp. T028 TaxID=3394379 RepID=UPI003A8780EC
MENPGTDEFDGDEERTTVRQRIVLPRHGSTGSRTAELVTFDGLRDNREHIALVWKSETATPLVRIHSECLTGDVFQSARCDCGNQLTETTKLMEEKGGILLYLRQEGRGIGLYNKIDAYSLQDAGADTVDANTRLGFPADGRRYDVAADMLTALGYRDIRLVTNNPEKVYGLNISGIRVVDRVGTSVFVSPDNLGYLQTKRFRMGHALSLDDAAPEQVSAAG